MRFPLTMVFASLLIMVSGDCGSIQPTEEMLQCRYGWMEPQFCDAKGWNESNPFNPR